MRSDPTNLNASCKNSVIRPPMYRPAMMQSINLWFTGQIILSWSWRIVQFIRAQRQASTALTVPILRSSHIFGRPLDSHWYLPICICLVVGRNGAFGNGASQVLDMKGSDVCIVCQFLILQGYAVQLIGHIVSVNLLAVVLSDSVPIPTIMFHYLHAFKGAAIQCSRHRLYRTCLERHGGRILQRNRMLRRRQNHH